MPLLRPYHSRDSSGELEPGIPLVDYSRTPSPSPYKNRRPEDWRADESGEDDGLGEEGDGSFLRGEVEGKRGFWRQLTKSDTLGGFLFGTWVGWQVYVGLLVVWSIAVQGVLVLMNRFILWSGHTSHPRVKNDRADSATSSRRV